MGKLFAKSDVFNWTIWITHKNKEKNEQKVIEFAELLSGLFVIVRYVIPTSFRKCDFAFIFYCSRLKLKIEICCWFNFSVLLIFAGNAGGNAIEFM